MKFAYATMRGKKPPRMNQYNAPPPTYTVILILYLYYYDTMFQVKDEREKIPKLFSISMTKSVF